MRPLHAEQTTTTDRRGSWALRAFGPFNATGPWTAFAVGLIAALSLAQPARSFARQPVAGSFVTHAPVPFAMAGRGLVQAASRVNVDDSGSAVSDTIDVDTLNATPGAEPPGPSATSPGSAAAWMAGGPAVARDADVLPFAHNQVPETFPSLGFGIGIGAYLSSFATVDQAFYAIEAAFSAGGFPVPRAADVELGPMVLPTFKLRFSRWVEIALQAGRAGGSDDELRLAGGLVSGRYALSPVGNASLFAGLGAGSYRFSFGQDYGVRVTPTDPNGGYTMLDAITLEGGGGYWTVASGFTTRVWPHGTLEALIQYVGAGDVSTGATRAGEIRVNMSGTMIAVSITSFF